MGITVIYLKCLSFRCEYYLSTIFLKKGLKFGLGVKEYRNQVLVTKVDPGEYCSVKLDLHMKNKTYLPIIKKKNSLSFLPLVGKVHYG